MQLTYSKKEFLVVALVAGLLGFAVYLKLDAFALVPGNNGDARLNNYFLENFYQFFSGHSKSLWHLSFFYPYPYVVGFSDNLFGTGAIYSFFRLISFESDTSYQLWFLTGYLANFAGAYISLKLLKIPPLQATIGALIFSIALPTSSHLGHAQLHYRFAAALSIANFWLYTSSPQSNLLRSSVLWLVFQFYCGIYIGFFTLLFIMCAAAIALMQGRTIATASLRYIPKIWTELLLSIILLGILFYPYLTAKSLYAFGRDWTEISSMLPRLQSYILADRLPLWNDITSPVSDLPMRHEHQMFIGVIPFILLVFGIFQYKLCPNLKVYRIAIFSSLLVIVFSLEFSGFSLWRLLYKLPLFSAIRAVTRFDQILLFPVCYICSIGLLYLNQFRPYLKWSASLIIFLLIFSEWAVYPTDFTPKIEWRNRLSSINSYLPTNLPTDSVLFVAQRNGPWYADEIDVMWAALYRGIPTLNGYSGNIPEGTSISFGADCQEVSRRLDHYQLFQNNHPELPSRDSISKRLITVGFDCQAQQ